MVNETPYGDYPPLDSVKKVLVVKLRQLGDVLLTTPLFSSLKNHLPSASIDAYVYSDSIPLLKDHPAINQIIGYDRGWKSLSFFKKISREFALFSTIRQEGYDLVINLTEGDRGAFAAKFSKASIRVGFDPKNSRFKKLYTHSVKNCPSLRHTVERNLDAIRRIGIFPSEEEKELFLKVDENAISRMRQKVPKEFILIHPTSRWMFKAWPHQKLRLLVKRLLDDKKELVFTAGSNPLELDYIQKATCNLAVHDLSGKVSLEELTALVHLSEMLLCVDSLPFHIASALKKPVVALFGPTSDVTWGPWNNPFAKILTSPMSCRPCYQDGCGGSKVSDCLVKISLEDVYQSLKFSPK